MLAAGLDKVSLSFLVDDMTKHWGGVAANICYSLALLGIKPHLVGTVGRDFGDYRQHLEDVGVRTTSVRQHDSVFTASFFGNTDLENNQISILLCRGNGLSASSSFGRCLMTAFLIWW
ncbi:MAG UNVERIFIED_CONTAM: PfkB family carbohydrate kinase [Anaerolineae bacterium]